MKNKTAIMICTLSLLSQSLWADIFGRDDRRNVTKSSQHYQLSRSVAVGVLNSLYTEVENNSYELLVDYLSDYMCLDEKFSHQPSLSYACTGFLIGEDLLLTAGHCSTNVEEVFSSSEFYCEAYTWMFDYHEHKKGKTNVSAVSGDNIYRCKEIIYAVSNNSEPHRDFALIRLDRKVTDRTPLKLASKDPRKNESVFMLGHPMGMPMKLTNNARVVHNDKQKNFFTTNLDAFSGNSGSPVFNRKKEVVGILVAGNPANSTYYDEKNKCERYNRCDNNGKNCKAITIEGEGFPNTGSDVQKITPYLELINRS